MERIES